MFIINSCRRCRSENVNSAKPIPQKVDLGKTATVDAPAKSSDKKSKLYDVTDCVIEDSVPKIVKYATPEIKKQADALVDNCGATVKPLLINALSSTTPAILKPAVETCANASVDTSVVYAKKSISTGIDSCMDAKELVNKTKAVSHRALDQSVEKTTTFFSWLKSKFV